MKKITIIICLVMLLSGCKDISLKEKKQSTIDEKKAELLKDIILQFAISYDYNVNVEINDNKYSIVGSKYDNIFEGQFNGKKQIPFQCNTNYGCYNLDTQKEDLLIFNDINYRLLTFEDIYERINSKKCECYNDLKCIYKDDYETIEYNFSKNDLFFTNIKLIQKNDEREDLYDIKYTNFNKVKKLEDKFHQNIILSFDFKKTDEINDYSYGNYHYILYNISDLELILNSQKTYLGNEVLKQILNLAQNKIQYTETIAKYTYEKDLVIYVKKRAKEKYDIYLSTIDNNAKILELLLKDN